jgi:predicted MFS family arabinose efflux permease
VNSTGNYRWRIVALLFLIGATNYGDRTAISSVFPLLRSEFGATDVELGAIGTSFLWAYALASPFAGSFADRFSRSRIIAVSLAAWSVVTLVTAFATSVGQILVSRVILGFAEAAYLPAAIALIADYHSSESRATAIGYHTAGLTFGLIAGGAGAGYLGQHYGWRASFVILGVAGLALAGFAIFYLRDNQQPAGQTATADAPPPFFASLKILLTIPSYLIILAEAMLVAIGTWIFLNWLPLFFKETYDLSLAAAGFAGTFMLQGAATIGLISGGYFSDWFAGLQPRRRMLIQTVSYAISAPFLLAFLFQPQLVFLNVCIFGFSFFMRVSACNETPLLCDLLAPRFRSTAIGVMNAANCLAGGIGILLAGFFKSTYGLAGIFGGLSGIMVAGAILTAIGYRVFLGRDLARRKTWELAAAAQSH